jgi:hypothetical protein
MSKSSFVTASSFNSSKIIRMNEQKTSHDTFSYYTPIYSYSKKANYKLLIMTDFIELVCDPFSTMHYNEKSIGGLLSIDTNDCSMKHLHQPFKNLGDSTYNYFNKMINNPDAKLLYSNPILSNSNTSGQINDIDLNMSLKKTKLFLKEYNNKITTVVHNYNKSKKYDPVTTYETPELSDLAKFIYKGKVARFIIEPQIWLSK